MAGPSYSKGRVFGPASSVNLQYRGWCGAPESVSRIKNEVRGMRACSDKGMRTSGVGARPLITLSLASPTAARIACESSTCCSACGRKGAGAHAPTTGANPNTLTSYDMPTFRLCKEGEHVARARQHHEHDLTLRRTVRTFYHLQSCNM